MKLPEVAPWTAGPGAELRTRRTGGPAGGDRAGELRSTASSGPAVGSEPRYAPSWRITRPSMTSGGLPVAWGTFCRTQSAATRVDSAVPDSSA